MSLTVFLLVGFGGAAGALCRGLLIDISRDRVPKGFPYVTLAINFAACFAAGCVAALNPSPEATALVAIGFLGGFSTLSTVNYEAATFFVHRFYSRCAAYLAITYAGSIAACVCGMELIHLL